MPKTQIGAVRNRGNAHPHPASIWWTRQGEVFQNALFKSFWK